jgi:two-component sensor histidine kinase
LVNAPSGSIGFGSKLINRAVGTQLGGTISREWIAEGLVVALTVQKDRLSH